MADENESDLQELLQLRLDSASALEKRLNVEPLTSIDGATKLRNRLASEVKFLLSLKDGSSPLERKYLDTSNLVHLTAIADGAEARADTVVAVLKPFVHLTPQGTTKTKHVVDIVAKNGDEWIKVISRSAKGIATDWLTGSHRNVLEQACTYLEMSDKFPRAFTPPLVTFEFIAGVPDKIAKKMRWMGMNVIGKEVPLDSLVKVPEDFLSDLECSDDEDDGEKEQEEEDAASLPPVNLDVSAVFVLISNICHTGGLDHEFDSALLTQQAEMERKCKARQCLAEFIQGRQLVMCKTANDLVDKILLTVGGDVERARWTELRKEIKVFPDEISEKAQELRPSERITKRSITIFGSGDSYRAITATANRHFVASAHHQGVNFDVFIHESRALSEKKELPLGSSAVINGIEQL